jgi:hypothetical protein
MTDAVQKSKQVLTMSEAVQEILRRIEQLPEEDRVALTKCLAQLDQAGGNKTTTNGTSRAACRSVSEILDDISRNRFRADPRGASVVDMLREDRNR